MSLYINVSSQAESSKIIHLKVHLQSSGWQSAGSYCFGSTSKCSSLSCVLCDGLARIKTPKSGQGRNAGDVSVERLFSTGHGSLSEKSFPTSLFIQITFDGAGFSWISRFSV